MTLSKQMFVEFISTVVVILVFVFGTGFLISWLANESPDAAHKPPLSKVICLLGNDKVIYEAESDDPLYVENNGLEGWTITNKLAGSTVIVTNSQVECSLVSRNLP